MSFNDDTWKRDRRDANRIGRFSVGWAVGIVALILVVGGIIWVLSVAVSGPKGQGDAVIQKNSSQNWVKQQQEFNRRYQAIIAMDKNITLAHEELVRNPDNQVYQINYSGLVRNCNDAVAGYNSLAREYNAGDFRDADLPASIDDTDTQTDCKEN